MNFTEDDRRIFRYSYRGESIALDPLKVARAFLKAMPDDEEFDALIDMAFKDMREVADDVKKPMLIDLVIPAQERIADLAREAFGYEALKPDGTGMTDSEAIDLMREWLVWEADLKKDGPNPSDVPSTSDGPADSTVTSTS